MFKILNFIFFFSIVSNSKPLCYELIANSQNYKFGLEFTFTKTEILNEGNRNPKDPGIEDNPIKKAAWLNWMEIVKTKCKLNLDCTTKMKTDKHGPALFVEFKDGYYFSIGLDSAVLEVNAMPLKRQEFAASEKIMQKFVFETALEAGLKPHERAGQGHIHVSATAFKDDSLLLRNFFVDFQNRPEIIYGALGNHLLNSPPLSAQKPEQRAALIKILSDYENEPLNIKNFIQAIEKNVYTHSVAADWGSPNYYQAFNLTRMLKSADSATLEIRSFRPQASPEIFHLQTILIERWIESLRALNKSIPYINKSKYEFTPQESVDSFYQLVVSLNLPWSKFKFLLPPAMQHLSASSYKSVDYVHSDFIDSNLKNKAAVNSKSFFRRLFSW